MPTLHYHGSGPIVGENPSLLILGTFPGLISRQKGQYYANPRNRFWALLTELTGRDFLISDYTQKLTNLQLSGIALWDMIFSCETDGSLDSEIQNEILVDLHGFLSEHPTIRLIAFNGGNAARYAKRLEKLPVPAVTLPSTSPANATITYNAKVQRWRDALGPYLR